MALVLSKDELRRIVQWTEPNKDEHEARQKQQYIRYLEETSREMTKEWPNSLENVNKRNEEARRARVEAAEQANSQFYERYVRNQQEEQRRLMDTARDFMFKQKDAPKMLLSAVIETVVQKERQEQCKFKQKLRNEAAAQKKKDDDEIIRKAKEWHELMASKKKLRFEANKRLQKEIIEQVQEITERKRKEHETELNYQKIDIIKANQQMDALKTFDEDFKAAEKARIWTDMGVSLRDAEQRRREEETRDRMDDQLHEVLQRTRARVQRRTRETQEQIKRDKLQVLEQISRRLQSGDAAREAKEAAILQKAINEREAIANARHQAELKKRQQFKQQRIDTRKKFLEDEERRLHNLNTMRQWEMMNRFKNAELYEDFNEKLRQEKARKTQQYKEDILKLWKERDDREAQELAERREFYGARAERVLHADDQKLLAHAQTLLAEARAHGRPDHALHRAINRYCCLYRLHPANPLPEALQKHFPKYAPADRCRLDTPTRQDDDKREGLQTTEGTKDHTKTTENTGEKRQQESAGFPDAPRAAIE